MLACHKLCIIIRAYIDIGEPNFLGVKDYAEANGSVHFHWGFQYAGALTHGNYRRFGT